MVGGVGMSKLWMIILSVLFIICVAVPSLTQEVRETGVRQEIEQRLAEIGIYVGNPGYPNGLRCVEILQGNQVAAWDLANPRFVNGQLIIPVDEFTRTFIDFSDSTLVLTVGDHSQVIYQLMDSCFAVGYPEKYMSQEDIFWHIKANKKKP